MESTDASYKTLVPDNISEYMFKRQGDKKIMIADNCKKYNRYGATQDRILVLTDVAFYLISPKKIHTKMLIKSLYYIIKTVHATSQEMILCFHNEGGSSNYIDVRLSLSKREQFMELLKAQY